MKRLRTWLTVLLAWLFVLYNIERLHEPINLASFLYVLVAVAALAIVLWPRLLAVPLDWTLLATLPVLLGLKWWFGYPIAGEYLPLTVTEVCVLGVTILLARRTAQSIEDFRRSVASAMVSDLEDRSQPFESGQEVLYREIRRARQFKRPLALLSIAPSEGSIQVAMDRFIGELQRDAVKKYTAARLAEFLSDEMTECDVITRLDGHFVTLLPEMDRARAHETAVALQQAAKEKLGLDLSFGLSTFPEEEVTLVGLLERAESNMTGVSEKPSGRNGDQPLGFQPDLASTMAPATAMAPDSPSDSVAETIPAGNSSAVGETVELNRPR